MYCKKCGRQTVNDSTLCPNCAALAEEEQKKQQTHDEWRAQMAQRFNQRSAANNSNYTQTAQTTTKAASFCSNCGAKLNSGAAFCSSCGMAQGQAQGTSQPQVIVQTQVITSDPPKKKKPFYKRWWFWTIAAILIFSGLSSGGEAENPQSTTSQNTIEEKVTIEETILYEGNGMRVIAKSIEDGALGTVINVLVENDSEKNMAVGCTNFVVNGITVDGYMYIDVAAGKKANGEITLYNSGLNASGIEKIATLESFGAYLSDTDTIFKTANIEFSLSTSAAGNYEQIIDDSGDILFEQDGIIVIAKTLDKNYFGSTVELLIKNESGMDLTVQPENVSVNGYTISTLESDVICDGTVRFCEVSLYNSELKDNEIATIEEVTFTLQFLDPSNFRTIKKTGELSILASE